MHRYKKEKFLPSGMIAAFTSALCTLSLDEAGRSLKGFWRGLTQPPHKFVNRVHSKKRKEKVTQSIIRYGKRAALPTASLQRRKGSYLQ